MKNNSGNYKIAVTGVMGALCIVLCVTPLGYINFGGLNALTIMHIPVLLATFVAGPVAGVTVGFIFGVTSLIRAIMAGSAIPFFFNPAVSILPRMIFPLPTYAIFSILKSVKIPKTICASIAAAFGTFLHTLFVMMAIFVFYGMSLIEGTKAVASTFGIDFEGMSKIKTFTLVMVCTLLTNGFLEIIAATILVTTVTAGIWATKNKGAKLLKNENSQIDKKIEV